MAQPRSQRIAIVLQLLTRKEQQAAHEFDQFRQRYEVEKDQLQQLLDYRDDYVASAAQLRGAVDMQQLLRNRSFMQQLADTQEAQQKKLLSMEQTLQQLRDVWIGFYHRRDTMAKLIKRYEQEEAQALDKLLQKELDELSANSRSRFGQ